MNFFDMGFMEILVIVVVALLVFGPEKLPDMARKIGRTVNNLKKMSTDMATQVKREIEEEEKKTADSSLPDNAKSTENEKTDDLNQ